MTLFCFCFMEKIALIALLICVCVPILWSTFVNASLCHTETQSYRIVKVGRNVCMSSFSAPLIIVWSEETFHNSKKNHCTAAVCTSLTSLFYSEIFISVFIKLYLFLRMKNSGHVLLVNVFTYHFSDFKDTL